MHTMRAFPFCFLHFSYLEENFRAIHLFLDGREDGAVGTATIHRVAHGLLVLKTLGRTMRMTQDSTHGGSVVTNLKCLPLQC